jgi:hypothetical protein
MEPSDALHAFRHSLYGCLHRRGDALFELTNAILTADTTVPSPVHLSFQASHRRGWGSLYAALDRGRIDIEALQGLLACHPQSWKQNNKTPVSTPWTRACGPAATRSVAPYSKGYYYHPSRHSAGQPIVAGWAYQFIAQIGFVRARVGPPPVDVARLRPAQDATTR